MANLLSTKEMLSNVYRCAGLSIRSPIALSGPVVGGLADIDVIEGDIRPVPFERPSMDVLAERVVDGVPWYTFAQCGDDVVARFYRVADFEIDPTGKRVTVHRDPTTSPEFVAILIAGSVVSFLLSAGGRLVLHASAVEVNGVALAFVGYSGQGKTTVATLLCADGYALVTDDLLPVDVRGDEVTCIPGGTELRVREKVENLLERFTPDTMRRLTADSRHAVAPAATLAERLVLGAVAVPLPDRESNHVKVRRLPAGEAAMTLARYQRIEGWTSPNLLRAQFEAVAAVAGSVPVLEIHVPWGPPFQETLARDIVAAVGLTSTPTTL